MTTQDFEALASQYGLDVDFVHQLHEKVVDKENFARAVKLKRDMNIWNYKTQARNATDGMN